MRRRRVGLFLAASGAVATMSLSASPAFAAGQGEGGGQGVEARGATIEEFVCFRQTGDRIRLGTGKVITTPSGNVQGVCTGKPLSTGPEEDPTPVPEEDVPTMPEEDVPSVPEEDPTPVPEEEGLT